MKGLRMKIKNMGMFTLITLVFLAIVMAAPVLNTVYKVSYIDMPEVIAFTVIAFVVYTIYFIRSVYVNGIRR